MQGPTRRTRHQASRQPPGTDPLVIRSATPKRSRSLAVLSTGRCDQAGPIIELGSRVGTVLNLLVPIGAPTAALAGAEQLSFDQIGGQTSPAVEHSWTARAQERLAPQRRSLNASEPHLVQFLSGTPQLYCHFSVSWQQLGDAPGPWRKKRRARACWKAEPRAAQSTISTERESISSGAQTLVAKRIVRARATPCSSSGRQPPRRARLE